MPCVGSARIVAVNKKVVWLEFGFSLSWLLASVVLTPGYSEFMELICIAQFAAVYMLFRIFMKGLHILIILLVKNMQLAADKANRLVQLCPFSI